MCLFGLKSCQPCLMLNALSHCTRYEPEERRWLRVTSGFLQVAIPGCTEQDAQWLVSLSAPVDSVSTASLTEPAQEKSPGH